MYNRRMVTKEELESQLHAAMKSGDEVQKRTLRMVLTEWKLAEVENGDELDDAQALALMQRQAKSRRETIADAERADRPEMAAAAQEELDYLETFLPQAISQDELERLVAESIEETGASDPSQMGVVMKDLMPKLQGRADGKQASETVRSMLS